MGSARRDGGCLVGGIAGDRSGESQEEAWQEPGLDWIIVTHREDRDLPSISSDISSIRWITAEEEKFRMVWICNRNSVNMKPGSLFH